MLNPDQFNTRRREDGDWDTYIPDDTPFFHGTTPENAESISQIGFAYGASRNGQSAGEGVYLHKLPSKVREYGDATVTAMLSRNNLEIHHNPWNDRALYSEADRRAQRYGGDTSHHISQVAHEMGYHGHQDPDDGAVVVYNPDHVSYLTHEVFPPRSRR